MNLKDLRKSWDKLGATDALFAVLTKKDKIGGRWDKDEFFLTGKNEVGTTLQYLRSKKIAIPSGTALDFGCGVGRLTQALADYFSEVHGVDIAESMIKLAREYNRKGARCIYHLNTENDLKLFPDAGFDFVYSKITLQHMEPQYARNYIKEFLRVLKPGGLIVFQMPERPTDTIAGNRNWRSGVKRLLPQWLLAAYHKLTPGWRPLIEMYSMTQPEVRSVIAENGGVVLDVKEDASAVKWISYQYVVKR